MMAFGPRLSRHGLQEDVWKCAYLPLVLPGFAKESQPFWLSVCCSRLPRAARDQAVAQPQQFIATRHYSDRSAQDLTKTAHRGSSSSGVATINNGISGGGLTTGKGVGSTTITTTFQGVSDSTTLTVN